MFSCVAVVARQDDTAAVAALPLPCWCPALAHSFACQKRRSACGLFILQWLGASLLPQSHWSDTGILRRVATLVS